MQLVKTMFISILSLVLKTLTLIPWYIWCLSAVMTLSIKQHFKASRGSQHKLQLYALLMLISHSHIVQVWSIYITVLLIHVLESIYRTFTYQCCHMSYYHSLNIHSKLNLLIISWLIFESIWNIHYSCLWYMVLDQSSILKLTYLKFIYNGHGWSAQQFNYCLIQY